MKLVADIGGTNTRAALAENGIVRLDTIRHFHNDHFTSLEDIFTQFLTDKFCNINSISMAVAGPIQGTKAQLTNRDWLIDTEIFQQKFNISDVILMNDLTALGYAVEKLTSAQVKPLLALNHKPVLGNAAIVIGIGTGCNASPVFIKDQMTFCPNVEVGHSSLALPVHLALRKISDQFPQIMTVEELFSGRGFENFLAILLQNTDIKGKQAVQEYAHSPAIRNIIDQYSALIGLQIRDFVPTFMPLAGIYFAGSVARTILDLNAQPCIDAFYAPSKIVPTDNIPLFSITDDFAALYGCAR